MSEKNCKLKLKRVTCIISFLVFFSGQIYQNKLRVPVLHMLSSQIFTIMMSTDICENKGVARVSLKCAVCLPRTLDLNLFISPHLNRLSKMNTTTSEQMRIRGIAKTTPIINPESPGSASGSLDTIISV